MQIRAQMEMVNIFSDNYKNLNTGFNVNLDLEINWDLKDYGLIESEPK